ncbi:hypothetical protein M0813_13729 [Anaeramoeba flamelloides]|uniref:Cation efflux protein transmembrane domain-containing protein n=1 Tax=Anaeramoeba flamelloides TaxID=1746091 RepID=A0ABQ8Z829_9EUKA|nr:hypothetical protein M0813_13729 [Anaeramoeba flamelloides]
MYTNNSQDLEDKTTPPVKKMSSNICTLLLMFTLFLLITVAQFIASFVSNSNALLEDSSLMAVDTMSYLITILSEKGKRTSKKKKLLVKIIAAFLSILILFAITIWVLIESVQNIVDQNHDREVDGKIVLIFSIIGLAIDLTCIFNFYRNKRKNKNDQITKLNMNSSLFHVLSDLLRSFSTLVESILIMYFKVEPGITDDIVSLIISSLIVMGSFQMFKKIFVKYRLYKTDQLVDISLALKSPETTSLL